MNHNPTYQIHAEDTIDRVPKIRDQIRKEQNCLWGNFNKWNRDEKSHESDKPTVVCTTKQRQIKSCQTPYGTEKRLHHNQRIRTPRHHFELGAMQAWWKCAEWAFLLTLVAARLILLIQLIEPSPSTSLLPRSATKKTRTTRRLFDFDPVEGKIQEKASYKHSHWSSNTSNQK